MMLIYPLGRDLSSLRSRRLEVVGERENGRARFFSKRLLRKLWFIRKMALSSVWTTGARTFRSPSKQHQYKRPFFSHHCILYEVVKYHLRRSSERGKKFIKISGYGYHLQNVRSAGGRFYSLPETPTSNQREARNCLANPRETRCGKKKPCWARLDTDWWQAGKTSSSFSLFSYFLLFYCPIWFLSEHCKASFKAFRSPIEKTKQKQNILQVCLILGINGWSLETFKFEYNCEYEILSAYYLSGNVGEKFLSNGTGIFLGTENRNGTELYHLQNTSKIFAFSRHEA